VIHEKDQVIHEKDQVIHGTFFADGVDVWTIQTDQIPTKDRLKSFITICREQTPEAYTNIVRNSQTQKNNSNDLPDPFTGSIGTNSQYPTSDRDIFNNPIDSSRAHVFLDSKRCAPGWGLMAEGATGKIDDAAFPTDEEKNRIRILRMMGSWSNKNDCLRQNVHNCFPMPASHRVYYDSDPQLLIIPLLPLNKIKNWDFVEEYEVLVLAASSTTNEDVTAAKVYQNILSTFDFDDFGEKWQMRDGKKFAHPNVCKDVEISDAFTVLSHFIKAQAHSLILGIPQKLVEFRENKSNPKESKKTKKEPKKGSLKRVNKDRPSEEPPADDGTTENKQWWDHAGVQAKFEEDGGVCRPKLKVGNVGRVLKLKFAGGIENRPLPDPWLLMAKAAVNWFYIVSGKKLLPACPPRPDESILQYEEALRLHELRARKKDIPMELSVPTTPGAGSGMGVLTSERIEKVPKLHFITPEKSEEEQVIEESSSWEYFSD